MSQMHAAFGRLAVSSIVAVLGFIALNQACTERLSVATIWWLVYCVGAGVVLNSEQGERPARLAVFSILPALIPALMAGFFVVIGERVCVSRPGRWTILLLPFVSWISIFVFSFARAPLNRLIEIVTADNAERNAKRAVSVIQVLIAGLTGCVLAVVASLGRS